MYLRSFSSADSCSDFSIDTVPTRIGWPRRWQSAISATMARSFSLAVR